MESIIKTALRAIASSFPVASSIAQAWNEYETEIRFRRVEEFFSSLYIEIEKSQAVLKTLEDYILNSGEIPSLIERTVEKVKRENSVKKRNQFAFLLSNSIVAGTAISYDDKLTFIETLDTLTDEDISVFLLFKEGYSIRVDRIIDDYNDSNTEPREMVLSRLIVSLKKLESRGLISESSGNEWNEPLMWGESNNSWRNSWSNKYFEILPSAVKFREMVLCDTT